MGVLVYLSLMPHQKASTSCQAQSTLPVSVPSCNYVPREETPTTKYQNPRGSGRMPGGKKVVGAVWIVVHGRTSLTCLAVFPLCLSHLMSFVPLKMLRLPIHTQTSHHSCLWHWTRYSTAPVAGLGYERLTPSSSPWHVGGGMMTSPYFSCPR